MVWWISVPTGKHYNNCIMIKWLPSSIARAHIHPLSGILTDGNFPSWHSVGCQCGPFPARSEPAEPGTHVPLRGPSLTLTPAPLHARGRGCEVRQRGKGTEWEMGRGLPLLLSHCALRKCTQQWHSRNGNRFLKRIWTLLLPKEEIKGVGPNGKHVFTGQF